MRNFSCLGLFILFGSVSGNVYAGDDVAGCGRGNIQEFLGRFYQDASFRRSRSEDSIEYSEYHRESNREFRLSLSVDDIVGRRFVFPKALNGYYDYMVTDYEDGSCSIFVQAQRGASQIVDFIYVPDAGTYRLKAVSAELN